MSTITNPASYYVTGNDEKAFTFKPGKALFNVEIYGSRSWIPVNIILMADNEVHVCQIMSELCDFRLACYEERMAHILKYDKMEAARIARQKSRDAYVELTENIKKCLTEEDPDLPEGFKITIRPAPMNQVFKCSWASNDNILG